MNLIDEALKTPFEKLRGRRLAPVTVAVVDSGVDATHPDLRDRMAGAWRIVSHKGREKPVKCRPGRNNDAFGHGTGVAGIIARLAPNARILDICVLGEDCSGSGGALLAGFRLAVARGARLINLSLACKAAYAAELHQLCELAYRRNQVVIAAKRNMPLEDNGFPAELSACVSVDRANFPSPFMLKFLEPPPIEFAAHGDRVLTTARGGGYTEMTGTSFATPTVTGLCALLVGAYPELRPFEIKAVLKRFARRGR